MRYSYIMKSIMCFAAIVAMACASSCGKEDLNPTEFPENVVPYDPTQSDRQYLEETATSFLKLLHPNEQRTAIVALNRFIYLCDNYYFPDKEQAPGRSALSRDTKEIVDDMESYDVQALSRAVTNYAISLSKYSGLYQANDKSQEWQFTENRDDLTFRFWISNDEFNLMIKGEGGSWSVSYNDDGDSYTVEVPKILKVVLFAGSVSADSRLIYAYIRSDGRDNDHLDMNTEFTFSNLRIESVTTATNTKMSEDLTMYIDNVSTLYRTTVMASKTQITGSSLCSVQAWKDAEDNPASAPRFTEASSTIMMMQRVQVKSQFTNMSTFFDIVDNYWEGSKKSEAEDAASKLRSYLKSEVYYAGDSNKVRATLGWQPYSVEYGYGNEEWRLRPTITFTSDGATFDFESYFGNGRFMSVENSFASLMNSYRAFWK